MPQTGNIRSVSNGRRYEREASIRRDYWRLGDARRARHSRAGPRGHDADRYAAKQDDDLSQDRLGVEPVAQDHGFQPGNDESQDEIGPASPWPSAAHG